MKLNQIDEFLYLKTKISIRQFFDYLSIAFNYAREKKIQLNSPEEKEIITKFNRNEVAYQIHTSSLILNISHVIELLLKSILYRKGEHLVFESIDNYLIEKEKWDNKKKEQRERIDRFNERISNSILNLPEGKSISYNEWINLITKDEEDIVPRSINLLTSISRLQIFLNWKFSEEFLENFKRLIFFRNEIIHFGYFYNVTFGSSLALDCLLKVCLNLSVTEYPKMNKLPSEYLEEIKIYNDFIQNIAFHEIRDKLFNEIELITKKALDKN